jgi:hypothetical protein
VDEDQEFIAPDNGGWHYTLMRDWIAVCPDIGPTSARLYWIIRSIMHEKGERARRLSYDQLCYLLPGVNGKPTGETRVKDALRELEQVGLLSNPDGDVVRRWVTDPKTGKLRKENFRRWKVHDYPAGDYAGWRSAIAKLDAYTEDWRDHISTEGRNSALQSHGKPATSENRSSSQRSTEGRNSASSRRNSDPPRRNSGDGKPATSTNRVTKNPSKEFPQPTNQHDRHEDAVTDQAGLAGWWRATPKEKTAAPTEGRSLLQRWGVAGRPLDEWSGVVDDAIATLGHAETQSALTADLNGVNSPARVIVGYRLPALRDRLSAAKNAPAAGSTKTAKPWCGECDEISRRYETADGRWAKCSCHPAARSRSERARTQESADEALLAQLAAASKQ